MCKGNNHYLLWTNESIQDLKNKSNLLFNSEDSKDFTDFYLINNKFVIPEIPSKFPVHVISLNTCSATAKSIVQPLSIYIEEYKAMFSIKFITPGNPARTLKDSINSIEFCFHDKESNKELSSINFQILTEQNENSSQMALSLFEIIKTRNSQKIKNKYKIIRKGNQDIVEEFLNNCSIKFFNNTEERVLLPTQMTKTGEYAKETVSNEGLKIIPKQDWLLEKISGLKFYCQTEILCTNLEGLADLDKYSHPKFKNIEFKLNFLENEYNKNIEKLKDSLVYLGRQTKPAIEGKMTDRNLSQDQIKGIMNSRIRAQILDQPPSPYFILELHAKDNPNYYEKIRSFLTAKEPTDQHLKDLSLIVVKKNKTTDDFAVLVLYNILLIELNDSEERIRCRISPGFYNRQFDCIGYIKQKEDEHWFNKE